jgi:hypothetical protein
MSAINNHVLEKGYRPTNKLDTSKPPLGGSAVPSIPPGVAHSPQQNPPSSHPKDTQFK